ncbi:alpha/beta hydrolase [Kurthia sibirica]|uniref:Alpha/beta hydrolase n=1 Tax=Kurthia sibirica TaxID=202750 RepID=A0A2U3AN02_9BACL|nr:alpha/beta hydrolase [Kurthia sibirica]PWI25905.1 alpha/beta hydrolase [Kurthia sibirica]GEK34257.1 alpha/beta hydrolase [Kurthia sibirica]
MKKWGWISGIILVVLITAYFLIGNFFYNLALNPHTDKDFMENNDNLKQSEFISKEAIQKLESDDKVFELKHPATEIFITSKDDLKLQALKYTQEKQSHKWMIGAHGYGGENIFMTRWNRHFYAKDYNIIVPNLRGHGSSEGDYIGMGWDDRKDIVQWIDLVVKEDPQAEIVLFGLSMGAATMMMTSGEDLPANVKVIVEDCGYTSAADVFTYQLDQLYGLPPFPVINAANTMAQIKAGYSIKEASALQQLKKNKTPILFIHGDADTFVPYKMVDTLYDATTVEKEKLIIKHAGHGEANEMNSALYWSSIWKFVDRYM